MKKFTEGMQVRFSMLYGGTVTAKVTKVTDTQITLTESWIAEDTMETVSEDTVYDKQVDENGNEYIITWEYYDHKGTVYGEEVNSVYKVTISSGHGTFRTLTEFATEKEAIEFCEENSWEYVDENGFVWYMDYEEAV